MGSQVTVPPALRALLDTAFSLARRSKSAQYGVARTGGVVDPEALPRVLREPVARVIEEALGQTCEPLALKRVQKILQDAWGRPPGKVLDALEPEPLAVGPGAQVHRAELDGAAVAVKVRRPGLATAVRSDLVLLDALSRPVKTVFSALDPGPLIREVRERVLDELDLEHQAAAQRQVARRLQGVAVPLPVSELSAPGVMVSELLAGPTLADATADDPAATARMLLRVHLAAAREAGLALADPRPDHVVLLDGGRIGLLGTGATRALDPARVEAALDALAALRADDAAAFSAAVAGRMGLLPESAAREAHALIRSLLGELLTGAARLDSAALAAVGERALAALPALLALAAEVTPVPEDLWAVRGLGQLAALLARLEVTEDWVRLTLDA